MPKRRAWCGRLQHVHGVDGFSMSMITDATVGARHMADTHRCTRHHGCAEAAHTVHAVLAFTHPACHVLEKQPIIIYTATHI